MINCFFICFCNKIQIEKLLTTWNKTTNHADFHVRSNWIFVDSTCFLMHSGQKTTKPRDISHLFYMHILAARNTSLHRDRRPLARSPFFLGISLCFCFSRHLLVAEVSASQNCGAATSVDAPTYVHALWSRLISQKVCFDSSSSSRRQLRVKMLRVC